MDRLNSKDLNKNKCSGFTIIEFVVVIVVIAILSAIMISNFPSIQKQFALSRATFRLAQDLRKTQDLGLSGIKVEDSQNPPQPITARGYGVYFNLDQSLTKYIIYADINPDSYQYDGSFSTSLCSQSVEPSADCIVEIIDISEESKDLFISGIAPVENPGYASINFSPPNPNINIDNIIEGQSAVIITLSNGLATKTVLVNTSGLISAQ